MEDVTLQALQKRIANPREWTPDPHSSDDEDDEETLLNEHENIADPR